MDETGAYAPRARLWRAIRWVLKAAWAVVAVYAGFMAAGIAGLFFMSAEYCEGDDPDPLVSCWPSWEQHPVANVAIWVVGAAVVAVLTMPLWFRRRRPGRAGSQRP